MRRWSLVTRIAMIVTAALFAGHVLAIAGYSWQREGAILPPVVIAERVEEVVRLLDDSPSDARSAVLAVANVGGFDVSVSPTIPSLSASNRGLVNLGQAIRSRIQSYAPDRMVQTGVLEEPSRPFDTLMTTFLVELGTGEIAVFTISDDATLAVWNIPIGFPISVFGLIVAVLAVLAVARETQPLASLAESVDELGNRVQPVKVEEKGARELRKLIRAINSMQERILGLVTNRTLFLGAISHDLKTYLTRFRLRLELMPENAHTQRAVQDVEAMHRLLDDVLLFADASSAAADAEIVDLGEIVERCAGDADLQFGQVELVAHTNELSVRIPEKSLRRVIDNLLSNALRYGTRAKIHAERLADVACVVIEDDGPGIAPTDLDLVFEPFYRAEPSRNRDYGGTGLGLTIVRQILEAHGGTITLENRAPEAGLRVTVCLPLFQ